MNNAFVYCWTDHLEDRLYVGSHKGSEDDGYVCSSKTMLEQYAKRPEDFTRQIIANGETNDMRVLEYKILNSVKAATNDQFYNQKDSRFFATRESALKGARTRKSKYDTWCSEEQRQKLRSANLGKKHSEASKNKMRAKKLGSNHPFWNKPGPTANRKWFHNPDTLLSTLCLPENVPAGFIEGRK